MKRITFRENITHLKSLRELFSENINKDITYLIKNTL